MANEFTNEYPLLRDPNEYPSDPVIENALKSAFPAFDSLIKVIGEPEYGLLPEWRYYRDGKAWLCKVTRKAKTVFWISIWDRMFRTSFYFTEKSGGGVLKLDIDDTIKKRFLDGKPIGKLKPLVVCITNTENIEPLFRIIKYKLTIK